MKQELSNTAINAQNELIFVVGCGDKLEDQIRIVGVNEHRLATEYDPISDYIPFKWT